MRVTQDMYIPLFKNVTHTIEALSRVLLMPGLPNAAKSVLQTEVAMLQKAQADAEEQYLSKK